MNRSPVTFAYLHPLLRLSIFQYQGQFGLVHQHLHFGMSGVFTCTNADRNHPQRVILSYMKEERRTPDRTRHGKVHCQTPIEVLEQ